MDRSSKLGISWGYVDKSVYRADSVFDTGSGSGGKVPSGMWLEFEGGVVSGVFNLESSGVEAPDWRPRHDKCYHEV
jgi:hypothetical protein